MNITKRSFMTEYPMNETWEIGSPEQRSGKSIETIGFDKLMEEFDKLSKENRDLFLSGEMSLTIDRCRAYQYNPDRGEDDILITYDEYSIVV